MRTVYRIGSKGKVGTRKKTGFSRKLILKF
jgi:hypothetical protein